LALFGAGHFSRDQILYTDDTDELALDQLFCPTAPIADRSTVNLLLLLMEQAYSLPDRKNGADKSCTQ
jgi:hypothetical protein